jgi:hypothetical protein
MSVTNEAAEPAELSEAEARNLTDRIKANLDVTWQLVAEAYRECAHAALGYPSWDSYVKAEFGGAPLWVPREARPEVVRALRASDMSTRAIAAAMGITERTVRRDLDATTAANAAVNMPATVTGLDGRKQPARRQPQPKPPAPETPDFDRSTSSRDRAAMFQASARKLLLKARDLNRLYPYAKRAPGENLDHGVAAVREAAEMLHKIADDAGCCAFPQDGKQHAHRLLHSPAVVAIRTDPL